MLLSLKNIIYNIISCMTHNLLLYAAVKQSFPSNKITQSCAKIQSTVTLCLVCATMIISSHVGSKTEGNLFTVPMNCLYNGETLVARKNKGLTACGVVCTFLGSKATKQQSWKSAKAEQCKVQSHNCVKASSVSRYNTSEKNNGFNGKSGKGSLV